MNNIIDVINNATSKSEICKIMNWSNGGKSFEKIDQLIAIHSLDVSFRKSFRKSKYELIEKKCPVCDKNFSIHKGQRKEKITCSHACSNTYFRSDKDHPNYKYKKGKTPDASYRKICFEHHEKKCVVCEEKTIVEVHHYDGNHDNNKPENLVPICPTHHKYWHSRYRILIREIVDKYVKDYVDNMVTIV